MRKLISIAIAAALLVPAYAEGPDPTLGPDVVTFDQAAWGALKFMHASVLPDGRVAHRECGFENPFLSALDAPFDMVLMAPTYNGIIYALHDPAHAQWIDEMENEFNAIMQADEAGDVTEIWRAFLWENGWRDVLYDNFRTTLKLGLIEAGAEVDNGTFGGTTDPTPWPGIMQKKRKPKPGEESTEGRCDGQPCAEGRDCFCLEPVHEPGSWIVVDCKAPRKNCTVSVPKAPTKELEKEAGW